LRVKSRLHNRSKINERVSFCSFIFNAFERKLKGYFAPGGVKYLVMISCKYCKGVCCKAGLQRNGTQKLRCKYCKRYQQIIYRGNAWQADLNERIVGLLVEGIGLRGMSRVLGITLKTVISRIKLISKSIRRPLSFATGKAYEMDELWTYIGNKRNEIWLMYVFDRQSKSVLDFKVGARTKDNLRSLVDQVLRLEPIKICTDGLNIYKTLIHEKIHQTSSMSTRHIERYNLNLRTHLKRLSRKTICFSKRKEMLEACLRIYFWR